MTNKYLIPFMLLPFFVAPAVQAEIDLIAIGQISATYEDMAIKTATPLENGVAGNLLGGVGSGFAYAGGNTFLALPDRGPNAEFGGHGPGARHFHRRRGAGRLPAACGLRGRTSAARLVATHPP